MAITNAEAIRFVNERIRPVAEQIRDLQARMTEHVANWNQGVSALVPNDALELLEDGREAEGVSRLTGEDVNAMVTRMQSLLAVLDAANVMDVVHKTTVRPLLS